MRYQLDVQLTEEIYLDFNFFTSFEAKAAKKVVTRSRILFLSIILVCVALIALVNGPSTFFYVYTGLISLFSVFYMIFFKKILKRNTKKQLKLVKKTGKLPFDPAARLEFYEDRLIDISPNTRTEQSYRGIERVCIVPGRFILLYNSSIGAYIIPEQQAKAQLDLDAFLSFIKSKCSNIEYY